MTLDELVRQLRAAHGDALLGVVLYGSTVGNSEAKQGHNVLVVVRSLGGTAIRAGGAIARAWQDGGNPVPLVLTEPEWRSSTDVFAIEHADIADRHHVVHAAPGFTVPPRSAVRDGDIRRQLEYELLAQVLAVRAAIASAGDDARTRRAVVRAHAGRAVALMRATVRLAGGTPPAGADAVCDAAARLAGFDPAAFQAANRQRRGDDVPKAQLAAVLEGLHAGLCRLVAYIDALPGT
jgi:hypothetical protein